MESALAMISLLGRVAAIFTNRTFALTGVVSLLSTAIVVAAVQSDGSTATNVRLDDGVVWVTNSADQRVGRLNVRIQELDFAIESSSSSALLQETVRTPAGEPERTVVFTGSDGGVRSLNVTSGALSSEYEIPIVDYRIGGGVGAVLERETGKLWVGSARQIVATDFPDRPDALVAPGSWLVVTQAPPLGDPGAPREFGRVLIVDGSGWYEVALDETLRPVRAEESDDEESGGDGADDQPTTTTTTTTTTPPAPDVEADEPDPPPIAEPVVTPLGVSVADIVDVSSVGPEPVVLLSDGTVVTSDGSRAAIPGEAHRLQQVGPASASVLVASDSGLFEVSIETGEVTELASAGADAAAPIRVGPCVYGAWSGETPTYYRSCNGQPFDPAPIPGAEPGAELIWRVNQVNVALNSPGNGDAWADADGTLAYVGNWSDVEPDSKDAEDDRETTGESRVIVERTCIEGGAEPPTAGDDQIGVRPRQTILNVLTNDDDPNCEPIAVTSVEPSSGDWGQITIIDNGQHLLYSPSDSMVETAREKVESFQFTYVVSDIGGNESSPATVTVTVKDFALGNAPPALRPKSDDTAREMRAVVEEGRSISLNVMPDWWDPDGDDLQLIGAVAEDLGQVASTPDGTVRFSANGVPAGVHTVLVTVSDGQLATTEPLEVTVRPSGSALPPVATDDFVTMAVGTTVIIDPLANDIDPNEDLLSLRPLWDDEANPAYSTVIKDDVVEITAFAAGVFGLDYEASDSNDVDRATIRLEIIEPGEVNSAPIAVPDQVQLRPNRIVNVDVLANDIDVDGDMLAVTDVRVAESDPTLGIVRATLVDRRMVQVEVTPGPSGEEPVGPFNVTYTVSDGRDAERLAAGQSTEDAIADSLRAQGSLTVLVQPPGEDQPPVLTNDSAVVRSGDIVAVPVLRNDIDPDADEIRLVSVDPVRAAELEAAGQGVVWVQGRDVYFQGGEPGRYDIAYNVEAGGRQASALLSVVVRPLPDPETNPNQPPDPPDLELRAIRNGTVRLQVPLFGVDPDGDSVVLLDELGPPSDPSNQVVVDPENPGTILFTAGRRSGATDSFAYTVRDRFGERGTGTVSVLVLDDGGWAPQAFDDVLSGKPGRTLTVPVLANDSSPQDRPIEIAALPFFDTEGQPTVRPRRPDLVRLLDQENPDTRGLIEVGVPIDGSVLVEHYRISDGFNQSDAFIRITPDPDAPNMPPVAMPDEVTAEEIRGLTEAVVDVVANDYDPDDAASPLRLSLPANQNASLREDGLLVVPLTETPQIVLYRVTDSDGDSAIGVVRVAGLENHPPVLSDIGRDPNQRVVDAATSPPLTILLDDITEDPDGDPDIRLTDTEVVLNGVGDIRRLDDGTGFVYTPPAELTTSETVTISFEVTDRPDRTPAERQLPNCNCLASLSIGVIVQASSPPYVVAQGAMSVPQLDEPVAYDLTPLTADDQGDPLTYVLDRSSFGGLEIEQDGPRITVVSRLEGEQRLPIGQQIRVNYTVSDGVFDPVPNVVVVTIVATNKGQPSTASFTTIEAERSVPISTPNVVEAAFNPFEADGRALTLINARADGDARVDCTPTGDCEFVSDQVGSFTVTYTLEDAVGQIAVGTIEFVVKGTPFAPGVPKIESVGDKVVNLTWTAADMQGGEFVTYHVTAVEADITKQFTSTGGTFDGLQNATTYTFVVVAENELGMGDPSLPSSGAIPDRVPDPPENLAFIDYGDRTLTVQWAPPSTAGDFSAITDYEIRIGGQVLRVDGGTTTLRIGEGGDGDPLSNGTDYSFEMRARNAATTDGGWGAWSSRSAATERPSRHPDPPTGVVGVNAGDGGTPRITVTWNAPGNDGGRSLTEYQVCRVQDGSCQTIGASTTRATFDAARASDSSFTVVAFNTDKNRNQSDPSAASSPVTAVGNPDAPVISSVTSGNRTLVATASTTNNSGCSSVSIEYSRNGGSSWQSSGTFTGLTNGQQYTIIARARLAPSCGTPGVTYLSPNSAGVNQTPYGPLRTPSISASGGTTITWNWATNRADDGRPGWSASLSGACGSVSLPTTQGATGARTLTVGETGQSYSCTITVSATGQTPISRSASANAPNPPPPPPPTVTVRVPPPDRTCPERNFTSPSNFRSGPPATCGNDGPNAAGFIALETQMVVSCRRNITYGTYNPWLRIQSGGPGSGWYVAAGTIVNVSGNWQDLPSC